jgi:hypothetical protein
MADAWSDEAIASELRHAIAHMAAAPAFGFDIAATIAQASSDPTHPLNPSHVRSEANADLFAAGVVARCTIDILDRRDLPDLWPVHVIGEVLLALTTISFIERCRSAAVTAAHRDQRTLLRQLLAPAAFSFRSMAVQQYLALTFAVLFAEPELPTAADAREWQRVVSGAIDLYSEAVDTLDSGLARAMQHAFDTQDRAELLIDLLRRELAGTDGALLRFHTEEFRRLAEPKRSQSPVLDATLAAFEA